MRRLVLHAGLPKTGTTSVQRFLHANAGALARQRILYEPQPPSSHDHNFLAAAFVRYMPRSYAARYGDDLGGLKAASLAAWRELLSRFRSRDVETLLVSGELFSRCDVEALADFVGSVAPDLDVSVIFYLRRPSSHYASSLQQHIKGANELQPFTRGHAKWSGRLAIYAKVGNLCLREFHPDVLTGGDVVADFAERLGIIVNGLERAPSVNESVSAEGMELLLQHRRSRFPHGPNGVMPQTIELLDMIRAQEEVLRGRLPLTPPALRPELAAYLDSDLEELAQLEELFGFRYTGIGPPVSTSLPAASNVLDGRVFESVADVMPLDQDSLRELRRRLEQDGVGLS